MRHPAAFHQIRKKSLSVGVRRHPQLLQLAEVRAPQGFARIDDVIPRSELEAISQRYKTPAGFGQQQLRTRKP